MTAAISSPVAERTRRRVLDEVRNKGEAVAAKDINASLGLSLSTVNRALRSLLDSGLVRVTANSRSRMWSAVPATPSDSSPYSSGGGGVHLEHEYVACLVAGFVAGDTWPELGDAVEPEHIRLQATDVSEVDDIVLEGRDASGALRRSSIAARRRPGLTVSDRPSVSLVGDFLETLLGNWEEVSAGRWRLILAVSGASNATTELAELTHLARNLGTSEELRRRFTQEGRTSAAVRRRYEQMRNLVSAATARMSAPPELTVDEMLWRLLANLTVRVLRLEQGDHTDRTIAVNALRRMLTDGGADTADSLFARLNELAGEWASSGAFLTQESVRRRLADFSFDRLPRFKAAWERLDGLSSRVRDTVISSLRSGTTEVELPRREARQALATAMRAAASENTALVVTGEPDIGKSAITLKVAQHLQSEGGSVLTLRLRDLPRTAFELEQAWGGHALAEIFSADRSSPLRLIVVDGAEAVLEGHASTLQALAAASASSGHGVVAITRSDGQDRVTQMLASAYTDAAPIIHELAPLTEHEQDELATTFPELARLRHDPRARWLLGRPGLLSALLRTGAVPGASDVLCEADVFRIVWRALIRNDENRHPGTASPDDRDRAAVSVARAHLGLGRDVVEGMATAELRHDAVLQSPNDFAFSAADDFTSDLYRDFALCRLFITSGWGALTSADAPRWSIRAARLACQAALSDPNIVTAWTQVTRVFSAVGDVHGDRWTEVPFEALLTLGDAERALTTLWESISADPPGVTMLLRVAESRFLSKRLDDLFVLRPIVAVVFCQNRPIPRTQVGTGRRTPNELLCDLVLTWLRGLAVHEIRPDALRQAVRDIALAPDSGRLGESTPEALALLGPDLDDRAVSWLIEAAEYFPEKLARAIESPAVAVSMSATNVDLLLQLSEKYYVDAPSPDSPWGEANRDDDGIRGLHHGYGSSGPTVAWYWGPFYRLLHSSPMKALGFINRMLNHAARVRVGHRLSYTTAEQAEPISMNLPGIGERDLVGDSHVWAWYRGTSVGPHACMSALLAVERFADEAFDTGVLPPARIVEMLLHECSNLAMAGLVFGFLVRHLSEVGELLDPFLQDPHVWHLEVARVVFEAGIRLRDSDADELTGSEWRRRTVHEVVGYSVVNAAARKDQDRLNGLAALGNLMREQVRAKKQPHWAEKDFVVVIDRWAATFHLKNYRSVMTPAGPAVLFQPPPEVEQALAEGNALLTATSEMYALQAKYAHVNDQPHMWPVDTLADDLASARRVEVELRGARPSYASTAAVAAAGVRAHALNLWGLEPEDVAWAIEKVLDAAESPRVTDFDIDDSVFPMGDDRAAAVATPLLFTAAFDDWERDPSRWEHALRMSASSLFDEVRANVALGAKEVWNQPCSNTFLTACDRHAAVWNAVIDGLIDCRLEPVVATRWERDTLPLDRPFERSLPSADAEALLLNRLRTPLVCAVEARDVACLSSEIDALWGPLWDAYQRALGCTWERGWEQKHLNAHQPIARHIIRLVIDGDTELLRGFVARAADSASGLSMLFDAFATAFTYDLALRAHMGPFWVLALTMALDAVGEGAKLRDGRAPWFGYMTASLMPTPLAGPGDADVDATYAQARASWMDPELLNRLGSRWVQLARRESQAVSAVMHLSICAGTDWAWTTGIDWVQTLTGQDADRMANRLPYLQEWRDLLMEGSSVPEADKRRVRRFIDALAKNGDYVAVALQTREEQGR